MYYAVYSVNVHPIIESNLTLRKIRALLTFVCTN